MHAPDAQTQAAAQPTREHVQAAQAAAAEAIALNEAGDRVAAAHAIVKAHYAAWQADEAAGKAWPWPTGRRPQWVGDLLQEAWDALDRAIVTTGIDEAI